MGEYRDVLKHPLPFSNYTSHLPLVCVELNIEALSVGGRENFVHNLDLLRIKLSR